MSAFKKATKEQSKLRLALTGPSGSGKTYTALKIATELGGKIAVIDTEHGSASKYADEFDFDVVELEDFKPIRYVEMMREAHRAGYDVLIIDSISHAWQAVLDIVEETRQRSSSKNGFAAWGKGTEEQDKFVQAMLKYGGHIIATMRVKTEYVIEKNDKGKDEPRKVGMAPVQRAGVEYEFDVVGDLDTEHNFVVTKTRCRALDQAVIRNADGVAAILHTWLTDGAVPSDIPAADTPPPVPVLVPPELDDTTRERLATVKNLVVEIRRRGLTPVEITPAAVKAASEEDYESLVAALRQTLETANELDDVPADLDAVAA